MITASWPATAALTEAASCLLEACQSVLGAELVDVGRSATPVATCASYAGIISCTHAGGGWTLVVAGDSESCARVAQLMLGEEAPPGDAEIGDALGELANITAGILKTKRAARSQVIQIGLPLVQAGSNCLRFIGHSVKTSSVLLKGDDLRLQLVLVYRDE